MKNYVKPSLEINKFEVEDIMTNSGVQGVAGQASAAATGIYNNYLNENTDGAAAANLVEFEW